MKESQQRTMYKSNSGISDKFKVYIFEEILVLETVNSTLSE